jgi:hypothetical protein
MYTSNLTLRCEGSITVAVENEYVLHIYAACDFVALGIQHAVRLRQIVICSICSSEYFPKVPRNGHDFRKKMVVENKSCFDFFYNVCPKHFSF